MRPVSAAMQTVLDNGPPYLFADLYKIVLTNGATLYWTNTQQLSAPISGIQYTPVPIKRGKASWKLGLSVDQMKITLYDDDKITINGLVVLRAGWQNVFDLAQVTIDRFITDNWANTAPGAVNIFTGEVGDVTVKSRSLELTVESSLAQLKSTFPRTYIIPSCANTLYDSVCGLSAADFTSSGTVGADPTASSFTLSGVSKPDGYFTLGKIKFTSGANNGQIRQIKSYTSGVITLAYPLYEVPAAGDTCEVIAGCDKRRATCDGRFSNITNFRGFPYVPDPNVQMTGAPGTGTSSAGSSGGVVSGTGKPFGPRGGKGGIQQKGNP